MARSFARVVVAGNLTRDPELRQTPNGTSVCQFGVAVNRSYKDSSGQWAERTSFFDVVVWGAQGENCARYLSKGRAVTVDGRLEQRSYEAPDGSKRSRVEIIADNVAFQGSPNELSDSEAPAVRSGTSRAVPPDDFRDVDFGGDDIPF